MNIENSELEISEIMRSNPQKGISAIEELTKYIDNKILNLTPPCDKNIEEWISYNNQLKSEIKIMKRILLYN